MNFVKSQISENIVLVQFSQDLIINHIEKIKSELDEVLQSNQSCSDFHFSLSRVRSIDMSFVHLWIALLGLLEEKRKNWEITDNLPEELSELLNKAGIIAF